MLSFLDLKETPLFNHLIYGVPEFRGFASKLGDEYMGKIDSETILKRIEPFLVDEHAVDTRLKFLQLQNRIGRRDIALIAEM
jgi:hypothetical protein